MCLDKKGKGNSDNRHQIIAVMVFFVNSITCCELGISIERVVSIKKPAQYHVAPLSVQWILLFIATTVFQLQIYKFKSHILVLLQCRCRMADHTSWEH